MDGSQGVVPHWLRFSFQAVGGADKPGSQHVEIKCWSFPADGVVTWQLQDVAAVIFPAAFDKQKSPIGINQILRRRRTTLQETLAAFNVDMDDVIIPSKWAFGKRVAYAQQHGLPIPAPSRYMREEFTATSVGLLLFLRSIYVSAKSRAESEQAGHVTSVLLRELASEIRDEIDWALLATDARVRLCSERLDNSRLCAHLEDVEQQLDEEDGIDVNFVDLAMRVLAHAPRHCDSAVAIDWYFLRKLGAAMDANAPMLSYTTDPVRANFACGSTCKRRRLDEDLKKTLASRHEHPQESRTGALTSSTGPPPPYMFWKPKCYPRNGGARFPPAERGGAIRFFFPTAFSH